ncbi:MAG TPA: hypothetical protein DDZ51_08280 [Planctomycetaceae bacterium]|nr:hypothetical protein [Planctomycetaceae bacterium]
MALIARTWLLDHGATEVKLFQNKSFQIAGKLSFNTCQQQAGSSYSRPVPGRERLGPQEFDSLHTQYSRRRYPCHHDR